MREQAAALCERAEVQVLYLDVMRRGNLRRPKRMFSRTHGFLEERVEVLNFPGLWQVAYLLTLWRELRRLRNEFGPQVVHAHTGVPAGWGVALLRAVAGAPVVLTEHSSEFTSWMRRPGLRWMARTAFRHATAIIAVGEGQRRRIQHTFGRRKDVVIIPNVVDTDRFRATPFPDIGGGYRMLLVGLMDTDQKGVHVLLNALDVLRKRGRLDRPFTVTIAGDGALRPQYEEQARNLGLSYSVHFVGRKTPDEIARLMAESQVLVMPSLHEAAPVALIEALASGRPAISTRCGGPEFMIDSDNGLIVDPGNAPELAAAIEEMLPNLHRYDPEAIAARAAALYSREAVTDRLTALYQKLIRR